MTKLFLIAASTVLTLASNPVVAREPGTAAAAPAEQSTTARAERPEQRYCVVETVTGSRIPHKTCQTRAEWLKDGFDPLNPDK